MTGAIEFTEIDHAAECIREALRKLPVLDPDVTAAQEGLGSLLALLEIQRSALQRIAAGLKAEGGAEAHRVYCAAARHALKEA